MSPVPTFSRNGAGTTTRFPSGLFFRADLATADDVHLWESNSLLQNEQMPGYVQCIIRDTARQSVQPNFTLRMFEKYLDCR